MALLSRVKFEVNVVFKETTQTTMLWNFIISEMLHQYDLN